jgi:hypothetical protein
MTDMAQSHSAAPATPATPNAGTFLNTLDYLEIPGGDATGYELQGFLHLLQRAASQHRAEIPTAKEMIIFRKKVAYTHAAHRTTMMAQAENAAASSSNNGGNESDKEEEKEEWREKMRLWGTCPEAVHACKAGAINLFLVASHPNLVWEKSWAYQFGGQKDDAAARETHYQRLADWHVYGIRIQDRTAWIYDSSYETPDGEQTRPRRLRTMPFMKRAMDLLGAYRQKSLRIDRIFIGGGGTSSSACQDMTCHWLRGEVMGHMGSTDASRVVKIDNWEEVAM